MTRLTWDRAGERFYEAGLDRGVLYVEDAPPVPWNGLVSLTESASGGETKAYFIDGVKYLEVVSVETFTANLEAFTYPQEFALCDGTMEVKYGLFAHQQSRKPFSLSYRTRVGNDILSDKLAYKIHIVYNALAAPSSKTRQTLGSTSEASTFSWDLTTRPPQVSGYQATAHFEIDSRLTPPVLLTNIENILYGAIGLPPRLPSVDELVSMFKEYTGPLPIAPTPTPEPGADITFIDAGRPIVTFTSTYDGGKPIDSFLTTLDGGTP